MRYLYPALLSCFSYWTLVIGLYLLDFNYWALNHTPSFIKLEVW
jgi:hypothetical protein